MKTPDMTGAEVQRKEQKGIEIGWRYAEIGPAERNVGQQRQNPPIHSSAALHGVARSCVAHLSSKEDTFYFPFRPQVLSPPTSPRRDDAPSAPQFMHSHVPPISPTPPPPLSYLSRSKSTPSLPLSASLPTAPLWRVFENVSFLRRELFSFLGVTRSRVTAGGGGGVGRG